MSKLLASWNVNGIRACTKNGFQNWLKSKPWDIIGLQEVRALPDQIPPELNLKETFHSYWFAAQKKGYSGVGILSKEAALNVKHGMDIKKFDDEGRVLSAEFEKFFFVSAYFPNSQDKGARLPFKLDFCEAILFWVESLRAQKKPVILCGDFNIAHQPIDLARPKENEETAGYLPEERAWMSHFIERGWVDTFRFQNPDKKEAYSWWSARMRARERNVGWRIDYHAIHKKDADLILETGIEDKVLGSDHCPVTLKIKI